MYTLFIYNLLATHTALGIVCAVLLFVLCFSLVHLARLVKFGWKYQAQNQEKPTRTTEQKPAQEQPKPKQETPAPVYYIVERKRKAKPSYTEPKQIRFK